MRRTKDAQRTMNNELRTMKKVRRGFTLTELVVTSVIAVIVILAIGITLAGSVQGWRTAYGRAYSDVAMESYSARRAFDGVVRKAIRQGFWLSDTGEELRVKYYMGYQSIYPDRYARFYLAGTQLKLEYGSLDASGNASELGTTTICSSVSSCIFKTDGRSVQMLLKLDSGSQTATIVSSAVMHNP